MEAALVTKIEKNMDRAASWAFASACGYAAYMWLSPFVAQPALGAETGGVIAFAYLCCSRVLRAIQASSPRMPVAVFDVREIESTDFPELLLTERYHAPVARATEEPLVLDDVLAELESDSRVVRLFDPAAMPTPAQLRSRIDEHLGREAHESRSDEAAQALHDALAQLRRSIR